MDILKTPITDAANALKPLEQQAELHVDDVTLPLAEEQIQKALDYFAGTYEVQVQIIENRLVVRLEKRGA